MLYYTDTVSVSQLSSPLPVPGRDPGAGQVVGAHELGGSTGDVAAAPGEFQGASTASGHFRILEHGGLVGGLEHFLFSHILGIIIPND